MTTPAPIRPRDREAVLQSLRAGVVPRTGIRHILVGREAETGAILGDLRLLKDGGSAFRMIIGDYGSGKSFFLGLARTIALEQGFVTMTADLSPERRLHATGGQARALYAALAASAATKAKADGGAMTSIVERFVSAAAEGARANGRSAEEEIHARLAALSEMPGGYDFAAVVAAYCRAHAGDDMGLAEDAVRWLRGEFATRTDARHALGVRTIIDDANVYDTLKLLARFVRLAGYAGLLVTLDELVNLYKLASTQARNANYEQILRILNDALQGASVGLGLLLGGTPDFLLDPRKGCFSYAALESRLSANEFARDGLVDLAGPVIRLGALSAEDLFILLGKIHAVFIAGREDRPLVPDEAYRAFMEHCARRIGDAYFRTPRTTIRSFVNLLSILEQNPGADWRTLLGETAVEADLEPELAEYDDTAPAVAGAAGTDADGPTGADALASFRIGGPPAAGS